MVVKTSQVIYLCMGNVKNITLWCIGMYVVFYNNIAPMLIRIFLIRWEAPYRTKLHMEFWIISPSCSHGTLFRVGWYTISLSSTTLYDKVCVGDREWWIYYSTAYSVERMENQVRLDLRSWETHTLQQLVIINKLAEVGIKVFSNRQGTSTVRSCHYLIHPHTTTESGLQRTTTGVLSPAVIAQASA